MSDFTTEDTEITEGRRALNLLTESVIGAAIEVHRELGPGLLESTYEMCLCRELSLREMPFVRQQAVAVEYKGMKLDCGYRAELIVAERVLIEIKAVETLTPIHEAQLKLYEAGESGSRAINQLQRPPPKTRHQKKTAKRRTNSRFLTL